MEGVAQQNTPEMIYYFYLEFPLQILDEHTISTVNLAQQSHS